MSADEKIVTDPASKGWVLDTNTGYYTWTGGSNMGPIQDGDTDGQVTTWSDSAQEWTPEPKVRIDSLRLESDVDIRTAPQTGGRLLAFDTSTDNNRLELGHDGSDGYLKVTNSSNLPNSFKITLGGKNPLTIDPSGNATFSGAVVTNSARIGLGSDGSGYGWIKCSEPTIGEPDSLVFGFKLNTSRTSVEQVEVPADLKCLSDIYMRGQLVATTTRTTRDLIKTLQTLRNATKDETTLEGLRDAIGNAIGGLIEEFENQIAAMPVPEEPVTLPADDEPETGTMDD